MYIGESASEMWKFCNKAPQFVPHILHRGVSHCSKHNAVSLTELTLGSVGRRKAC